MDSGAPQHTYWPVPLDLPNGQHCQVKNNDVLARGDPFRNIGERSWKEKYGERRYLPRMAAAASVVPGLRGGVDVQVNGGSP